MAAGALVFAFSVLVLGTGLLNLNVDDSSENSHHVTSYSADRTPFHDGFVVKWAVNSKDTNAFYHVPRTLSEAKSCTGENRWVEVERYTSSQPYSVYCQRENERFCIIFDRKGFVAGMQHGVPVEDIANSVHQYPFHKRPAFQKVKRFGRDTWVSTVFFVNRRVLEAGGRKDLSQGTLVEYWQQIGPSYTDVVQIPLDRATLTRTTPYKLEKCINGMGVHYYKNITNSLPCEDFYPWFQLYKDERITGVGFQTFGNSVVRPNMRHYAEEIPIRAVRASVFDLPECIIKWITDDNFISLHVYFVSKPYEINTCT